MSKYHVSYYSPGSFYLFTNLQTGTAHVIPESFVGEHLELSIINDKNCDELIKLYKLRKYKYIKWEIR